YGAIMSGLTENISTTRGSIVKTRSLIWSAVRFPRIERMPDWQMEDQKTDVVTLLIGGIQMPWNTRASLLPRITRRTNHLPPATDPNRQVLVVANEHARVVDLLSVERLLNLSLLELYPSERTYIAYRLPDDASVDERSLIFAILRNLTGSGPTRLFAAVSADTQ